MADEKLAHVVEPSFVSRVPVNRCRVLYIYIRDVLQIGLFRVQGLWFRLNRLNEIGTSAD